MKSKVQLSSKFMAKINEVSKEKEHLTDETSYLEQWEWNHEQEHKGTPPKK